MKVEAGTGLGGPGLEPLGPVKQTGAVASSGELGCGHPEGKAGVEGACGDVRAVWE